MRLQSMFQLIFKVFLSNIMRCTFCVSLLEYAVLCDHLIKYTNNEVVFVRIFFSNICLAPLLDYKPVIKIKAIKALLFVANIHIYVLSEKCE